MAHVAARLGIVVALAGGAGAQEVGSSLPREIELEDVSNAPFDAWEDLAGRAVLIEFFAHW